MSVMVVTSVGDIVIDLLTDRCPITTKNFLKLCKIKYYNGCLFHKVEKDFMAQTGDRTGVGTGGESIYRFLYGEQARYFDDEIHPDLKHSKMGTVAMASAGKNCNASQFYLTLRDDIDYLDGKHTIFGTVEEKESLDTLIKINEAYVDGDGRPFKDIRIKHTYVLDDPFDDPPQLSVFIPEKSPEGKPEDEVAEERLEDNWVPLDATLGPAELEEHIRSKEAHTNAAILESIGDIPDAEIKPPDNVLFVCKLNPVTQDEDLNTIFSRFGAVVSADIIRDYKTGDSLCYAFIEFETKDACERAYFKMDNVLIDDRRIHVDFSQSVSKLWSQYRGRNRASQGGCFKCGATDHVARDCRQGSNNRGGGGPAYILREENKQHGGGDHTRYEMLFDGNDLERSEGGGEPNKKPKLKHAIEEGLSSRRVRRDSDRNGLTDLNYERRRRNEDRSRATQKYDEHRPLDTSEKRDTGRGKEHVDSMDHRKSRQGRGSSLHEDDNRSGRSYRSPGRNKRLDRDRDRVRDEWRL